MIDAFHALADPTRRRILTRLSGRQLPAGVIAEDFPHQRPAISKHLTILKQAGLIEETRDRQRRLYSIRRQALEPVANLIRSLNPPDELYRPTPPVSDGRRNDDHLGGRGSRRALAIHSPRPRPCRVAFDLEFD